MTNQTVENIQAIQTYFLDASFSKLQSPILPPVEKSPTELHAIIVETLNPFFVVELSDIIYEFAKDLWNTLLLHEYRKNPTMKEVEWFFDTYNLPYEKALDFLMSYDKDLSDPTRDTKAFLINLDSDSIYRNRESVGKQSLSDKVDKSKDKRKERILGLD